MKFSFRQILASVGGAVIAAIIASAFGVKGTIVGVAIGSAAATMGTALVAQSIERGQEAVKQAVVRAPDASPLLRKLGATGLSGGTASSVDASSTPTEAVAETGAGPETGKMESATTADETGRLEISAVADAPATERLRATTTPMQPAAPARVGARRFSWQAIAGTAAIVFVLALLLITAIELISGKPLSAIFGNAGSGTSVGNVVNPPPTASTTTTTTPSSTTSTSSATTTSSSTSTTSTTSTTAPSSSSSSSSSSTTSTTVGGTSTTTTSPGSSSSTSTTVAGTATSP